MIQMLQKYQKIFSELTELINDLKAEDCLNILDDCTKSTYLLYKELISRKQHVDEIVTQPIRTSRVIKCKRVIPKQVVDTNSELRVVMGGVYVISDVYLLPMNLLEMATKEDPVLDAVDNPETYGLPSDSLVMYSTRRRVSQNLVVALPKGTWLDEYLITASHYEYPYLD